MCWGSCSFQPVFAPRRSLSAHATAWLYWRRARTPNTPFQTNTRTHPGSWTCLPHVNTDKRQRSANCSGKMDVCVTQLTKQPLLSHRTQRVDIKRLCRLISACSAEWHPPSDSWAKWEHVGGAGRQIRETLTVSNAAKVYKILRSKRREDIRMDVELSQTNASARSRRKPLCKAPLKRAQSRGARSVCWAFSSCFTFNPMETIWVISPSPLATHSSLPLPPVSLLPQHAK